MTSKSPLSEKRQRIQMEPTRISAFGDISFVSKEKILDPLEKLQSDSLHLPLDEMVEALISWCQKEFGQDKFAEAYADFQHLTGRVFYDEEFFHQRVNYFLLYFIFDRTIKDGETPYHIFLKSKLFLSLKESNQKILNLEHFIHSLFLIHKIAKQKMILKDMVKEKQPIFICDDGDYTGMIPGSMIQGFLFKKDQSYSLASGFILHPKAVYSVMRKSLKESLKNQTWNVTKMVGFFSKQNLNFLRRRNLDAKKIYLAQDI